MRSETRLASEPFVFNMPTDVWHFYADPSVSVWGCCYLLHEIDPYISTFIQLIPVYCNGASNRVTIHQAYSYKVSE